MATKSQVKAGLDDIAAVIRAERQALVNCKARIAQAEATLVNLPTKYEALINTIDGYTPTGAFETLAKSEKADMATEFVALRTKATSAKTALDPIDFTT